MSHETTLKSAPWQFPAEVARRHVLQIRLSLHAVVLAAFLLSMSIGVQALKITRNPFIMGGIVSCGLAVLYLTVPTSKANRRFRGSGIILWQRIGLLLVLISALQTGRIDAILQSVMLVCVMTIITMKIPSLNQEAILSGCFFFAIAETGFLLVTRTEWNSNAFCNHMMFAALCGAAGIVGIRSQTLRRVGGLWICGAVVAGFVIGSRTATLAMLIVSVAYLMIKAGRIDRFAIRLVVLSGIIVTSLWSTQINEFFTELAIDHVGNNNPVAHFFLKDKSPGKLREDLFDRREIWEAAVTAMVEHPLLGIGYEVALPGFEKLRAHNSYLEIGYQCGIPAMLLWAIIYFYMVEYAVTMISRQPQNPIVFLAFTSAMYLVLAGLMESSGILSLGTPGNWIAILCFLHLRTTPPVA